jgi:hypothetical protein
MIFLELRLSPRPPAEPLGLALVIRRRFGAVTGGAFTKP